MACSPRLSHLTVTPAQFFSVTVRPDRFYQRSIERGRRLLVFWIRRLSRTRLPRQDTFNPLHILVARKTFIAVLPFYGDVLRLYRDDRSTIRSLAIKAD